VNNLVRIFLIIALLFALKWIFLDESVTIRAIDLPLDVRYLKGKAAVAGQPALVEFWATWCAPCLETIPHLNEIYAQYQPRGLQFVSITTEDEATVQRFLTKRSMEYPIALDAGGKLLRNLHVTSIPRAFLVDRTGKVTWQGHPMDLNATMLEAAVR